MSGTTSNTLTVPAPPTTADVAADLIAWLGGQSGVITDVNVGSQVRTEAEAVGSVVDMQSEINMALAFQAIVYAGFNAFNVFPLQATSAVGVVTFSTGSGGSPPPAPFSVIIPPGTLVQTIGGTQFQTTTAVTLAQNATSVNANVSAVIQGSAGDVPAQSVTQIVSALPLALVVTNSLPMAGGNDVETPGQTMARFTTIVGSIGLGTPVAVANSAIGVVVSGTTETVKYSTAYEPWITQQAQGVINPTAGFILYVDNGSGTASSNLLAAVSTKLSGNLASGQDGYRPAGVPFGVSGVVPVNCQVQVNGTALNTALDAQLEAATSAAVQNYFTTLLFGQTVNWTQIVAAVADAVAGNITSLNVTLLDASGVSQQVIQPLGYQRAILQTLTAVFS